MNNYDCRLIKACFKMSNGDSKEINILANTFKASIKLDKDDLMILKYNEFRISDYNPLQINFASNEIIAKKYISSLHFNSFYKLKILNDDILNQNINKVFKGFKNAFINNNVKFESFYSEYNIKIRTNDLIINMDIEKCGAFAEYLIISTENLKNGSIHLKIIPLNDISQKIDEEDVIQNIFEKVNYKFMEEIR